MAFSPIRRFTFDDAARLNLAASRFVVRHGITLDPEESETVTSALDLYLEWANDTGTDPHMRVLRRLWQACRCRALKVPVTANVAVAYGFVGTSH